MVGFVEGGYIWIVYWERERDRASVYSMPFNLRDPDSLERQRKERGENVEKVKGNWVTGREERGVKKNVENLVDIVEAIDEEIAEPRDIS